MNLPNIPQDYLRNLLPATKKLIMSDIVLLELEEAPSEVRDVLNKIPKDNTDYVFLNQESMALANRYLKEGVIAGKSFMDARHIAIATVDKFMFLLAGISIIS